MYPDVPPAHTGAGYSPYPQPVAPAMNIFSKPPKGTMRGFGSFLWTRRTHIPNMIQRVRQKGELQSEDVEYATTCIGESVVDAEHEGFFNQSFDELYLVYLLSSKYSLPRSAMKALSKMLLDERDMLKLFRYDNVDVAYYSHNPTIIPPDFPLHQFHVKCDCRRYDYINPHPTPAPGPAPGPSHGPSHGRPAPGPSHGPSHGAPYGGPSSNMGSGLGASPSHGAPYGGPSHGAPYGGPAPGPSPSHGAPYGGPSHGAPYGGPAPGPSPSHGAPYGGPAPGPSPSHGAPYGGPSHGAPYGGPSHGAPYGGPAPGPSHSHSSHSHSSHHHHHHHHHVTPAPGPAPTPTPPPQAQEVKTYYNTTCHKCMINKYAQAACCSWLVVLILRNIYFSQDRATMTHLIPALREIANRTQVHQLRAEIYNILNFP